MPMENVILIVVLAVILGGAAWYIIRAQKRGQKCIGCPDGGSCSGKCAGCTGSCGSCQSKH